jgi:hypothetical protein
MKLGKFTIFVNRFGYRVSSFALSLHNNIGCNESTGYVVICLGWHKLNILWGNE